MAAQVVTPPSRRGATKAVDDDYLDTVVAALRARLRSVSEGSTETLEVLLGPASDLAERVTAAVPSANQLAVAVGPVYRQAGLARAAGCTRQAVGDWIHKRRVLALTTADGVVLVPASHLTAHLRPLPGLDAVLRLLTPDVVDAWTLASWLAAPQQRLHGESVLQRLVERPGDATVLAIAESAYRRWVR